jgi:hypothetical protein
MKKCSLRQTLHFEKNANPMDFVNILTRDAISVGTLQGILDKFESLNVDPNGAFCIDHNQLNKIEVPENLIFPSPFGANWKPKNPFLFPHDGILRFLPDGEKYKRVLPYVHVSNGFRSIIPNPDWFKEPRLTFFRKPKSKNYKPTIEYAVKQLKNEASLEFSICFDADEYEGKFFFEGGIWPNPC